MPREIVPARLIWCAPFPYPQLSDEQEADNLRSLALQIETLIDRRKRAVALELPVARLVSRALFDLADRIDR